MASELDGAGQIKMQTLAEAQVQLQRVHTIVEHMAIALKNQKGTMQFVPQLKRAATPMIGLLKGQFGPLADQMTTILLSATRGGSEQMRVRGLREGVGLMRQQLEIAMNKTKEKHAVADDGAQSPD
jgi:hypothetical protein